MNDHPALEELPLRAQVGWLCNHDGLSADADPANVVGRLFDYGVLEEPDIETISETLEVRRDE